MSFIYENQKSFATTFLKMITHEWQFDREGSPYSIDSDFKYL